MTDDGWRVIVVRAWRDGDRIKVRVLVEGDGTRSWIAGSAPEGLEIIRKLLDQFEAGDTPPSTTC